MTHNGVVAAGGRLTDWISLGVLASSVPRDAVDEAIAAAGKGAKRSDGKLPPHVMVYFAMAMALFAEEDYEEVAGCRPPVAVRSLGRRSRSHARARRAALDAVATSWTIGGEEDGPAVPWPCR